MTLSTSSSAYSLPSVNGGYNLRANSAAAQNAPPLGSGNFPNPIDKRVKLSHSHPDRSLLSKARDVLEEGDLFFKLCEMERQIDEKILKKQNEIAASSFRSNKLRRSLKIYVSNSFSEGEGNSPGNFASGMSSLSSIGNASNENISGMVLDSPSAIPNNYGCWILRIEGKIDQTGLNVNSSSSGLTPSSSKSQNLNRSQTPKKFSNYLKSLIIEFGDETVEWNKFSTSSPLNTDGFEIKRAVPSSLASSSNWEIPCNIHLQFDFSPERFRLAPALANLLNLTLATRPAIVVALWQYIKLHKLQESDEKKIINNDSALQELFKVPRMSFSDIPVLIEPYLLPPEPVTITYQIKNRQELNVLEQVFELEVDVDDPKSASRTFLPANLFRDLSFYEGRLKELIEALHSSKINHKLLKSFAENPIETAQKLLKTCSKDFETLVGDIPVTLDELRSSEFYENDVVVEAVTEFLALNPRFLPSQI